MSMLQRGMLDPNPFWVSLGAWNWAIQEDNPGPVTARIKDQMLAADPFLANDGSPADALDFFAMFIGAHPIREEYLAGPLYAENDAATCPAVAVIASPHHLTAEM